MERRKIAIMKKFTAVSLFCGAGGLDMGFENAGFHTIWANDFNSDACKTHQNWSKAKVVCNDISKINIDDIPTSDVVLGGFPCQGFSLSGPRKIDDSRNSLYKHYVKVVARKQPKIFVGENVKGLLTMADGQIMEAIISEFSDCGYNVFFQLVNAKYFGVPQDRERVIISGFRKDLNIQEFQLQMPQIPLVTLKDALKDMKAAEPNEVCQAPYSSRYMSRNRKRDWNEVSYTIPAMAKQVSLYPGSPNMIKVDKDLWQFGDGGETRRLSWREAAVIQSFPKEIEFYGDLVSKYKQIGNAVPVKLAECVANQLREVLEEGRTNIWEQESKHRTEKHLNTHVS